MIVLPQPPPAQVRPAEESTVSLTVLPVLLVNRASTFTSMPLAGDVAGAPPPVTPVTAVGLGLTFAFSTLKVTVLTVVLAEPTRRMILRGEPIGVSMKMACAASTAMRDVVAITAAARPQVRAISFNTRANKRGVSMA